MKIHTLLFMLSGSGLALSQTTIPSSWAYPSGSGTGPGFTGTIRQARQSGNLTATIARGNSHLNDLQIDPDTSAPYENTVVTRDNPDVGREEAPWPGDMAVNPDGSFSFDGIINFTADNLTGLANSEGNFTAANGYPDSTVPGLPGETVPGSMTYTNFKNFSVEFLGFIELPAGPVTLTVHNDDAMQLAFHPNDARDIFRQEVVSFNTNGDPANRSATLNVTSPGLYSFRLLHVQWNGLATLELYANTTGSSIPVNGAAPSDVTIAKLASGNVEIGWTGSGTLEASPNLVTMFSPTADQNNPQTVVTGGGKMFYRLNPDRVLPVYQSVSGTLRSYISDISPANNASGVAPTEPIVITMENRNGSAVTLTVEGSVVTPDRIVDSGSTSTVTYTAPSPFAGGQIVDVQLDYGNAQASWSYAIETGQTVLFFGNTSNPGDAWVATRLNTEFGLDVNDQPTSISVAQAEQFADEAQLVYISSSVLGGDANAQLIFSALADNAVPIICIEQATVDELDLEEVVDNQGSGTMPNNAAGRFDTITIIDEIHPAAAGLTAGSQTIFTSDGEQHHWVLAPVNATLIGQLPPHGAGSVVRDVYWVVDAGATVNPFNQGSFVLPAKRAFFGYVGNDGVTLLNTDGMALWDAMITWMLAP